MHSFDDLLNHLDRAGIVPAPDELADALWLARHMRMRQTEQADGLKEEKKALPRTESEQPPTDIPPPRKNPDSLSRRSEPERIYPKTMRGGGFSARAFRSPAIPMLPDRLNLDRSLRPLRRKVPSPSRLELDEEASVRHIAETGLWQPKLRGEPERCYNLMLVADWGESMRIWGPTIKELQRLLEREGRGLRTWYLDSDRYYPELYSGPDFAEARRCSPEEIFGSRGRHLLLLLSDCTACAWHSGGIFKLLALWGRRLPLALVQMLPDRLWAGTALGYAAMTHYHAVGPLSDNRRLYSDDCSPGADSLNLPVLNLEPDSLGRWAALVSGRGQKRVSGVHFDGLAEIVREAEEDFLAVRETEAEEMDDSLRLHDFLHYASPNARRLAACLAAAPLTLPVMRLVQQRMAPGPQSELAEVFLSSLIRPRDSAVVDPMLREYDFYGNLRDRLLNTIDAPATLQVLLHVSRYLSEHLGNAIDFQALLRDPDASGDLRLDEDARHFAEISALVLKRFGGKYLQAAKVLNEKSFSFSIPEMVSLPGETFIMGDDKSTREDEKPAHQVTLSPFSIGQYPVTFEEYDRFCEATKRKKPKDEGWGRDNRPVINVSWEDAVALCEWLSERTGEQYRLPTEAEWEYACRGGSETAYCFGDDENQLVEYAWYGWGQGYTHPVGEKKSNAFDLYDMHGNVWEWCADWFGDYPDGHVINPIGSDSGSSRMIRGGSWLGSGRVTRSGFRHKDSPGFRSKTLGFRFARGQ